MRRKAVLLILICTVAYSYGQRVLNKSLVNKDARFFYLDAGPAYRIQLETNTDHKIDVRAVVEGEYSQEMLIDLREDGSNVYISPAFSPEFQPQNDKLSAHKVVSVSLNISLPEGMSLSVKGIQSDISVRGKFQSLSVYLKDGRCNLHELLGIVNISTVSAAISVSAKNGVVRAQSDSGVVEIEQLPLGDAEYNLRSDSGNIKVLKIPS